MVLRARGVCDSLRLSSLHARTPPPSPPAALLRVLGPERKKSVLVAMYLARCDVTLVVRQTAARVWKSVVVNSPRALKSVPDQLPPLTYPPPPTPSPAHACSLPHCSLLTGSWLDFSPMGHYLSIVYVPAQGYPAGPHRDSHRLPGLGQPREARSRAPLAGVCMPPLPPFLSPSEPYLHFRGLKCARARAHQAVLQESLCRVPQKRAAEGSTQRGKNQPGRKRDEVRASRVLLASSPAQFRGGARHTW